jgi:hypothetical protein
MKRSGFTNRNKTCPDCAGVGKLPDGQRLVACPTCEGSGKVRGNKHNARRTHSMILDRTFHSAGEARFAEHLFAREQNGEIRDLIFQAKVDLVPGWRMRPDFRYVELCLSEQIPRPQIVWHEFKGYASPDWKRAKRVWAEGLGPGIYIVTYPRSSRHCPYRNEIIVPKGFDPNDNPNIIEDDNE